MDSQGNWVVLELEQGSKLELELVDLFDFENNIRHLNPRLASQIELVYCCWRTLGEI